jgi:putative FmdB family regulatory protein
MRRSRTVCEQSRRTPSSNTEESRLIVPVYVYRREDGSTFEIQQRMSDDSLVSCPTTGQRVERVLQPFSPRYKGAGFYTTDHRKPRPKEAQPKNDSGD